MNLTLPTIPMGKKCYIKSLTAIGPIRRRLLDLGFVPGASVTILRKAPLGDPTAYLIRGAVIALREEEGALIEVEY